MKNYRWLLLLLVPLPALAADLGLEDILKNIYREILNPAIIFAFAAASAYFIFGVVRFIWDKQEGKDDGSGQRHMMWGLIGMFIMASAFGIIQLVANTFDLTNRAQIQNGQVVIPDTNPNNNDGVTFTPTDGTVPVAPSPDNGNGGLSDGSGD